jgi:hypothetical protein
MRRVELVRLAPANCAPHLSDVPPVLVELHDPMVDVSIGHEDVALRIPPDVGWPGEDVSLRRRRIALRCGDGTFDGLGPAAQDHQNF